MTLVVLVFGAVNLPSITTWTAAGRGLWHFLDRPGRLRAFNWTTAGLLLASTLPML